MALLLWYLGFVVLGNVGTYLISLFVEYEWGTNASLISFLVLYFFSLWVAWVLAVWASKPHDAAAHPRCNSQCATTTLSSTKNRRTPTRQSVASCASVNP